MVQLQPDIIVARISDSISSVASRSDDLSPGSIHKSCISDSMTTMDGYNQTPFQPPEYEDSIATKKLITGHFDYWVSSPSRLRFLLGSIEYSKQCSKYKGRQRQEIYAKYQLPSWLSTRVWECKAFETLSGWRLNLGTYRTLPNTPPSSIISGAAILLAFRNCFPAERPLFRTER